MEKMENVSSHQTFILNGFDDLGALRPILFIPYSSMFVLSFVANVLLIYVIISQKNLHSPMYILIACIAVVDLGLPLCFVPQLLLSFLLDWRGISVTGCLLQMFFVHLVSAFHSTVLVWMSLDRYFAICTPLHYHKHMALLRFMKFAIPFFIRNVFLVTLVVILAGKLWFCGGNVINHCFCEHMAVVELACGSTAVNSLLGLVSVFLIPVVDIFFIVVSYMIVFVTVLRSGRSGVKALHTCVTHMLVMVVTLAVALIALLSYRINNNLPSAIQVFFSTMYMLFPSCFNPIIYGIRTTEIRLNILKTLSCC
ncbi:olfactory receptor 52N2-like [Sphaeramia orbicularis]|uniref:olfactory receptor 52N2-like n=1 Tax=Sphaeramia orbicularis TaxID=375764 RepID=UPI00117FD3A4|nr:olfactory receptor 52N2-like [Sphaeramia orbicularis]